MVKGRGKTGKNCKFEFVCCKADRGRKTDIETERQTQKQKADIEVERQTKKQKDRYKGKSKEMPESRQTDRQTDRQIDKKEKVDRYKKIANTKKQNLRFYQLQRKVQTDMKIL